MNDLPRSESSWRFPGWPVVAISAAAMVATLPGRTVGLGLITEPLLSELAIAKTTYANLTFWATVLGATFSLACGPAIDRWGAKRVLAVALLLVGCTTAGMGSWVTAINLLVFLILARGLGQSSLSTASVTAIGKWFSTKVGIALGLFSALVAIGFVAAIPILGSAITIDNWRTIWIRLGGAIGALGVATFLLMPRQSNVKDNESAPASELTGLTLGFALRSPAYWIFTTSTALYYLVLSGLTLFNEALIAELGYGHDVFINAMTAMMGAGLIGNFAYGWLSERTSITRMLAVNLLMLAVVLYTFPWLNSSTRIVMHAALYGIVGGAFAVLFFIGYSQSFGKRHLGKIQGTAQVFGVIASAIGPKLLAETQAATGSFLPAFRWLAPAALVMAVWAWMTRIPSAPQESPCQEGVAH